MSPEHTAIHEAHLWSYVSEGKTGIRVQHPNGVFLTLQLLEGNWFIRQHMPPDRPTWLATAPQASGGRDFASAVKDTLRVAGPDAQAQLDDLLFSMLAWGLSLTGVVVSLRLSRPAGIVYFPGGDQMVLPPGLMARFNALDHVLRAGGGLPHSHVLDNRSLLTALRPSTAHGMLALRARAQEEGPCDA